MYLEEKKISPTLLPMYSLAIFFIALGLDAYIWFDQLNNQLFLMINHYHTILPDEVWDKINMIAYTKYMIAPTILILATSVFRRDKLVNVVILIGAFFIVFAALKYIVAEARPFVILPHDSFFWINDFEDSVKSAYRSFPSGHTGNIAMLAFAMNYLFFYRCKILQFVMLLLVIFVGVARICTGWHWPVDVITSGLISYVLVKIILSINLSRKKTNHAHY